MKYAHILLFVCTVGCFAQVKVANDLDQKDTIPAVVAVEVTSASMLKVKELQIETAQDLYKRYLVRNLVKGAICAGCVAACYMCQRDYKIVSIDQVKDMTRVPYGWIDTFWQFGGFVCQGIAASHVQYLLHTRIFHEFSIEWFAQEQTALIAIYKEIETFKVDVERLKQKLTSLNTYQSDHYLYSFVRMHNALVLEVEKMLGYIYYKSDVIRIKNAHLYGDAYIATYLYERIQDVSQVLHESKQQYDTCVTAEERAVEIIKIFECIEAFTIELNSSIASFKRLETQFFAL